MIRTEFELDELHTELLFKPVDMIKLPTVMDGGLVISLANLPGLYSETSHTFEIRGDGFAGYIIASLLRVAQEPRTRYSPYSLFHGYTSSDYKR
ncbi:hypothetical protein [Nonomuraea sp. NPDC049784]|uniref:hypothetical protein n=1 Tax=Nonomuraea sp. NPDC049784 TaxID=3154361 RepID=UPI0033D6323A